MSRMRRFRQLFLSLLPTCAGVGWALAGVAQPALAQSQPYMGTTMLFAGSFCPAGWLEADGRTIAISEYDALYTLLGTTFGGDGQTTFGLPDLRGRTPRGIGSGQGLTPLTQGERQGSQTVQMSIAQMPQHAHSVQVPATTAAATHAAPSAQRVLATTQNGAAYASASTGAGPVLGSGQDSSFSVGAAVPIDIRAPYLGLRWCVAVYGIFPSQN